MLQRDYRKKMAFIELKLKSFDENPVPSSVKCFAVLKFEKDVRTYMDRMRKHQERIMDGLASSFPPLAINEIDARDNIVTDDQMKSLRLANLAYSEESKFERERYFQMTIAKADSSWNLNFLCVIPIDELNTESGIVIEYYKEPVLQNERGISDIFGYSVLLLFEERFSGAGNKMFDLDIHSLDYCERNIRFSVEVDIPEDWVII
jgi:hypothetical protein